MTKQKILLALGAMAVLITLPLAVIGLKGQSLIGIVLPYLALGFFLLGFIVRLLLWARSPVPFRIVTTCGQGKSLPWIKANPLENPSGTPGVLARMAGEILLFRSLFRNTKFDLSGDRLGYDSAKWLWFFALVFHWSLFVILVRHLRFFLEPVGPWVTGLALLDGFLEISSPPLFLTNIAILLGLSFLLLRRLLSAKLRYISLFSDYFAVLLLGGIVATGILMRHFYPVDILAIKALARGWASFTPVLPQGLSPLFYVHLFLISCLLVWFPASKLMHLGGVFLSPTRNLAGNSRSKRHVNPWNAPVKVHPYKDYEDEFRAQMKTAGLPVEEN